jgi:hypothetical protein
MGEWDASGMDDRREEFAMLRHLAWEGAGLAPSIGSTTFKKTRIQRRIPAGCSVKEAGAQRSRVTSSLTALKAGAANQQS